MELHFKSKKKEIWNNFIISFFLISDVNEPSRNAKIDRLIAAYLAKDYVEDEDNDDGSYFLPEEKKRSNFRERDENNSE